MTLEQRHPDIDWSRKWDGRSSLIGDRPTLTHPLYVPDQPVRRRYVRGQSEDAADAEDVDQGIAPRPHPRFERRLATGVAMRIEAGWSQPQIAAWVQRQTTAHARMVEAASKGGLQRAANARVARAQRVAPARQPVSADQQRRIDAGRRGGLKSAAHRQQGVHAD